MQKKRRGKARPCYARSTTKTGQSWRSTIDESGKFAPAKCPKCGAVIVFDHRGFPSCGQCDHALSHEDREAIEVRDPEAIRARHYMKKLDAKIKRMSGKERREKRFLSKCAWGQC
jgi:ribosomal protein S27AE